MKAGYAIIALLVAGAAGFAVYQKYTTGTCYLCSWRNVPSHDRDTVSASTTTQKSPVIVVNVLDKKFYDDAHIAKSINVPYEHLKKESQKWDKNATIIIYCADYQCGASREGVKELTALGFSDVRAYEGGMAEWHQLHQKNAAYAFEGPAQEKYLAREAKPHKNQPHMDSAVKEISAEELLQLLAR